MDSKLYRSDIDGLRAIAVLSVILYHFGLSTFQGGFVGVDVFFVISGFLITRIIQNQIIAGTFRFRDFYIRRARRIMPALVFTMVFTLVGATIFFSPQALKTTAEGTLSALFSVSNIFFWKQNDYFNLNIQMQPLLHTWSLSLEEQFYLIWPAFLLLGLPRCSKRVMYVLIALLILGSIVLAQWIIKIDASAAFYLIPFRVAEFGIGAVMVWLNHYRVRPVITECLCVAGLTLIAYAVLFYQPKMPFPGLTALVPCVGAAFILYSGNVSRSGGLLRNEAARRIGLISYSLYLVHWPIIVFARYQMIAPLTRPHMLCILIVSLCLAAFMYRFVEQPFRKDSIRGLKIPHRRTAIITVVLVLIIAVSMQSGWYWRLGDRAADLIKIGSADDYQNKFSGGAGCSMPTCTTHVPGTTKPKIYVLGDSHALMYYTGFKELFSDFDIQFWTSSGCQLFSPEYDSSKGAYYRHECDNTRREAFAAMAKNDGTVILTQMWGIGKMGLESQLTGKMISFPTYDDYGAFVAREIHKLKEKTGNHKVIVIGDMPGFGRYSSPLDCISRPYFQPDRCMLNTFAGLSVDINENMRAHLEDAFVDPTVALCGSKGCRTFVDGKPAYSDDNHLSIDGTIFTMKTIEPKLRDAIKQVQNN